MAVKVTLECSAPLMGNQGVMQKYQEKRHSM